MTDNTAPQSAPTIMSATDYRTAVEQHNKAETNPLDDPQLLIAALEHDVKAYSGRVHIDRIVDRAIAYIHTMSQLPTADYPNPNPVVLDYTATDPTAPDSEPTTDGKRGKKA